MRDLMKCFEKFYGMQVSMTKQFGDFLVIFTINQNMPNNKLLSSAAVSWGQLCFSLSYETNRLI